MNGNLEPHQFDTRFLVTVIAIIVLCLAALAWGWRNAHSSPAASHASAQPWPYDAKERGAELSLRPMSPATASRNP